MNATATGSVGADGKTPTLDAILAQHTKDFVAVQEEAEEQAVSEGAETAQGDGTDTETGADTAAEATAETSEETAETGESDEAAAETESAGIDEALRALDEANPAMAKAVRSLQTAYNKSREEIRAQERERAENDSAFKAKMGEVDQILADYKASLETEDTTGATAAEGQVDDLERAMEEEGLNAEQKAMYRKLFAVSFEGAIRDKKLVSADALAQQAKADAQRAYVAAEHKTAATAFGEAFGKLDGDALVMDRTLNAPAGPHAKTLAETRNRLSSPDRGMTWTDVWKVARYDAAVQEAYQKGLSEAQAKAGQATRIQQRKNAATVTGSAPVSNGTGPIKALKGESRDALLDRIIRLKMKAV